MISLSFKRQPIGAFEHRCKNIVSELVRQHNEQRQAKLPRVLLGIINALCRDADHPAPFTAETDDVTMDLYLNGDPECFAEIIYR